MQLIQMDQGGWDQGTNTEFSLETRRLELEPFGFLFFFDWPRRATVYGYYVSFFFDPQISPESLVLRESFCKGNVSRATLNIFFEGLLQRSIFGILSKMPGPKPIISARCISRIGNSLNLDLPKCVRFVHIWKDVPGRPGKWLANGLQPTYKSGTLGL